MFLWLTMILNIKKDTSDNTNPEHIFNIFDKNKTNDYVISLLP